MNDKSPQSEKIIRTLNYYNEIREKASAKDPSYVSMVIQNPFVQALKVGFV